MDNSTGSTDTTNSEIAANTKSQYVERELLVGPLSVYDFLATGFYSGYLPKAPGTWGTLAAFFLTIALQQFFPGIALPMSLLYLGLGSALLGALITTALMKSGAYGDRKDPQQVVIDEFAGFFITAVGTDGSLAQLFIAFLVFRFFDITKLPPIRKLESLPMGWGVMADDVLAGIYGLALCYLLRINV